MSPSNVPATTLTEHARSRMDSRRISVGAVEMVMAYGRSVRARGAQIYALGKKEVALASKQGLDLRSYTGLQVVCSSSRAVLTAYRNQDFRSLRRSA
jgi:hypothetical protein